MTVRSPSPVREPADWDWVLGLLENGWRAAFAQALAGLSPVQYRALLYVARHPSVTMGQIATGLGVSYPAASKLVRRLEWRRWVSRRPQPTDRREVQVELTAAGRRRLTEAVTTRRQLLERTLGHLSRTQQAHLWRAVEELLEVALAAVPDWKDVCLACGDQARPRECPLVRAAAAAQPRQRQKGGSPGQGQDQDQGEGISSLMCR